MTGNWRTKKMKASLISFLLLCAAFTGALANKVGLFQNLKSFSIENDSYYNHYEDSPPPESVEQEGSNYSQEWTRTLEGRMEER